MRAATTPFAGDRDLSSSTGLQRLGLHEVCLQPGQAAAIKPAGAEAFVYVLSGSGTLTAGTEEMQVNSGDFVGLGAEDRARASNNGSTDLTFLSGGAIS